MLQIAQPPPFPLHARTLMNTKRTYQKEAALLHSRPTQLSTNFSLPSSPSLSSFHSPAMPLPLHLPVAVPSKPEPSRPMSPVPSLSVDVLCPGDFVGEGCLLQGEEIRLVSCSLTASQPAPEFEVVRRLGTGSYAVVYLVREVLARSPPSEDGHGPLIGPMDFDGCSHNPAIEYGGKYAIKCLSKENLNDDALAAQMAEVTIHQSLCSHPNIVTLHRTLETSSYLLLVLEYVPGEDLFYFLEQARDHYNSESAHILSEDNLTTSSYTPPTPSLLSSLNPAQLLSRTRLRLISSMFAQMCEAVAACHVQQVFHRDIKPENFIVTDGWAVAPDGSQERKVIVKLTDFGLSTTDIESSDMDCGSAPYMSYECRNNTAPTYRPRGADVWSLGIVLINMLYHYNPWSDTTQCPSFDLYCQQPVQFFMDRFSGMTLPVAEYLATKVFCILDDPIDDTPRASASEFGAWAKDLPALFGVPSGSRHKRVVSSSSTQGHPISGGVLQSHRPSSRQASMNPGLRPPTVRSRSTSRSRAPSHGPLSYPFEVSELSTVYDQELDVFDNRETTADGRIEAADVENDRSDSRSTTSNTKRRKRGARRGKGSTPSPVPTMDDNLASLADRSQALAREISRVSQASGRSSSRNAPPLPPPPPEPMPMPIYRHPSAVLSTPSLPTATIVKKPSMWKRFGRNSGERALPPEDSTPSNPPAAATAKNVSNVSNLIMSLNPPPPLPPPPPRTDDVPWSRGRRMKSGYANGDAGPTSPRGRSAGHTLSESRRNPERSRRRHVSPTSTRTGRLPVSSTSSTRSNNWRNSVSTTSSAGTSTSAFTSFSNSSVSTMATSVSGTSRKSNKVLPDVVPRNIKVVDGVTWSLSELPRQVPSNPSDEFSSAGRKVRVRKPKDGVLDTITERPGISGHRAPFQRRDAMTSTSDLSPNSNNGYEESDSPKKVAAGQKDTLAKLLSALRI